MASAARFLISNPVMVIIALISSPIRASVAFQRIAPRPFVEARTMAPFFVCSRSSAYAAFASVNVLRCTSSSMVTPSNCSRLPLIFGAANKEMKSQIVCFSSAASSDKVLQDDSSLISSMLYRIRQCNIVPDEIRRDLVDFEVDGRKLGVVTPKVAQRLVDASSSLSPVFEYTASGGSLTLSSSAGISIESRTKAVASVMQSLRESGFVSGWRDELYPVKVRFDDPDPVFLIERAAASVLGVLEYGVHLNGLVRCRTLESNADKEEAKSEIKMWMARRSKTKSKFPGYLDHMVAGGQPAGLTLLENVIKECEEEAGIPYALAANHVRPTGAISYETYVGAKRDNGEGVMSRVVLFCYDLELPEDFTPEAMDGEVEAFFTWTMDEVAQAIDQEYNDPIKPNCYPVIIDYLLRTGYVSPDTPGYLDVLRELRSGNCQ